jgi:hypothetical protein
VYFEGNAPGLYDEDKLFDGAPFVTVFYRSGTTGWGSTLGGRPTALWSALSVQHSGGSVIVSWPKAATDFVLDENPALASAWTQVPPETYQTNATSIFITLPSSTGNKFYRLRKP